MPPEIENKANQQSRQRKTRTILALLGLAIILLIAGGYVGMRAARANPDQPLPYSHRVHVENGIQCLYCHSDAARSQMAGIPSVEKCMGCHNIMATENETVQKLARYWEDGQPIPWQPVNIQPEFIYFSHQPHMSAGLNCETCHGNVSEMEEAEKAFQMDMGWCLECHEHQEPERVAYLLDCLACHK